MAAPRILVYTFDDLRSQRVVMEVFQKGQEVSVAVAKDGFVPTLEEMSHGLIPSVIVHGITLVDALEDFRKRGVVCFDEEMNMVGHKYEGVELKR
jgi:hypothetical protein